MCKEIFFFGISGGILLSIILRMEHATSNKERTMTVVDSPLSQAVSQMVGIAGGIYVALVLLLGFLEIKFPQEVQIANITLNPLALCSILLACIQPILSTLWKNIKNFLIHRKYW